MLPRLYESLRSQTTSDFEWLVVDDGSTDDTDKLVRQFASEAGFPVRYRYKENGGKHTAYNLGLELAEGKWFFCVDSDDFLAPDAVERIVSATKELSQEQGIIAYKQDTAGKLLSGSFPEDVRFVRFNDLTQRYGCDGEFSLIFSTDLARKYPFPVFSGEKFVTESVVYDWISEECEMLLLPRAVTVCEYQQDGYSQNANAVMGRNPSGFCLYFMQRIDMMPSLVSKIVCAGKYWCFRWISKNKTLRYTGKNGFLCTLGWPVGLIFRVYYKAARGF
jgi:glycosyltransferase involved in cell wall biosynthesis